MLYELRTKSRLGGGPMKHYIGFFWGGPIKRYVTIVFSPGLI